jgi:hypothetical protein
LHLPAATKLPPLAPGKCCAVVSRHTICVRRKRVIHRHKLRIVTLGFWHGATENGP